MELKVVVPDGSLAEHQLVPEAIMDAVQATLARMNVKAAISLVEESPLPVGYEDAATDDGESDDAGMTDLVTWIEEEFGGPVVAIMPSSAIVEPGGETYWVCDGRCGQPFDPLDRRGQELQRVRWPSRPGLSARVFRTGREGQSGVATGMPCVSLVG
jgi:hypothetical protein